MISCSFQIDSKLVGEVNQIFFLYKPVQYGMLEEQYQIMIQSRKRVIRRTYECLSLKVNR